MDKCNHIKSLIEGVPTNLGNLVEHNSVLTELIDLKATHEEECALGITVYFTDCPFHPFANTHVR